MKLLYQVQHRTTANEPRRIVQQTQGQKGLEAWHGGARRYDKKNMEDNNSAYAAFFQHHQSTRCTYETNKLERMGKIRYEEKMRAVRLREMTLKYEELLLRWKTSSLTRYHQSEEGRHKCSNVNGNGHEG